MHIVDRSPAFSSSPIMLSIVNQLLALLVTACLVVGMNPLYAAPQGKQVMQGEVSFEQEGSLTTIAASHQSIISYQRFDIRASEVVQFIQPSASATVLILITDGENPSQILGSIQANGRLLLVNPAGIVFGKSASVDAGALYAVSGQMNEQDFLYGLNHFSDMEGIVENHGTLRGELILMIGKHVVNTGGIYVADGMIRLMAGSEVYLGQDGNRISGNLESAAKQELHGIENTGILEADGGSVVLTAADPYSFAIHNMGIIKAADITVDGGGKGTVKIAGTLDTSNPIPGEIGGTIKVLGDKVNLHEYAAIDASGDAGGGEVLIGGDYQGKNPEIRNASRTYVGPDTVVRADATVAGDGGKVIIWAEETTGFGGFISARGGNQGGNGGFAEVSGKQNLLYRGMADLTAPLGATGTLLLDPDDIIIQASGSNDIELSDNQILAGEGSGTFTLSASAVVSSWTTANTSLAATNDITINAT